MVNEEDDESDVAWFWSMNAISDDAFLVIAQNNQTLLGTDCAYTDQRCFDHNSTWICSLYLTGVKTSELLYFWNVLNHYDQKGYNDGFP